MAQLGEGFERSNEASNETTWRMEEVVLFPQLSTLILI
ncbi:hypothetical protein TGAMA5MH_07374 [Trichoderma gamsii]|uniref:Uncharacterized protein n=1 Tax=Trichoderma gamsii TaxID=398673 RepID=A0A2K0T575_9HYPO|nr:hypothetical protein TGAMA5MH_07374 [Trichoderma gamsii]